jgi:predicted acetyltransferase
MGYSVRVGTPQDFEAIARLMLLAFHDSAEDDQWAQGVRLVFEPSRSLVAVDGVEIVGHVGAYTRDLTVPGSVMPAAFVTMVGVAGTHRRKGIARQLLVRQLHDARAAGEALAVLWASEGRIYPRFGYGMATRKLTLDVQTREVSLGGPREPQGRVRVGVPQELVKDAVRVYDSVRPQRPGYASRPGRWWDFLLQDPPSRREGGGPRRMVVHDGPSGVDGYALYRVRASWQPGGPNGQVDVHHLVAGNPVAYKELWRWLLDIDLTRGVNLAYGSLEEPLLDMVDEPSRLRARLSDGLWLRVLDVQAALAGRRFVTQPDLVIEVTDPLIAENNGRFLLDGTRASGERVPDLALDIATLGGLFLGGGSAGALTEAGRIVELRPGAVAEADAAFRWHRAPVGIEAF